MKIYETIMTRPMIPLGRVEDFELLVQNYILGKVIFARRFRGTLEKFTGAIVPVMHYEIHFSTSEEAEAFIKSVREKKIIPAGREWIVWTESRICKSQTSFSKKL